MPICKKTSKLYNYYIIKYRLYFEIIGKANYMDLNAGHVKNSENH